ncbi:MAG: hypothetical protein WC802_00375 [Patescibacteria group bacterium]
MCSMKYSRECGAVLIGAGILFGIIALSFLAQNIRLARVGHADVGTYAIDGQRPNAVKSAGIPGFKTYYVDYVYFGKQFEEKLSGSARASAPLPGHGVEIMVDDEHPDRVYSGQYVNNGAMRLIASLVFSFVAFALGGVCLAKGRKTV